jgi:hypothetical protein
VRTAVPTLISHHTLSLQNSTLLAWRGACALREVRSRAGPRRSASRSVLTQRRPRRLRCRALRERSCCTGLVKHRSSLARAARARRDSNNPRNDLTSARASTPLGKTAGAQPQASTCELGHPESGRRCLIRNQVYPRGYRGFESLSLRRVKQGSRPAAPVSDIATAPPPSEVVWPQER